MKNLKITYLVTLLITTLLLSCDLQPKNTNLPDQHAQVVVFYPGYPDTLDFTFKEWIRIVTRQGYNYVECDFINQFSSTAPLKLLQP